MHTVRYLFSITGNADVIVIYALFAMSPVAYPALLYRCFAIKVDAACDTCKFILSHDHSSKYIGSYGLGESETHRAKFLKGLSGLLDRFSDFPGFHEPFHHQFPTFFITEEFGVAACSAAAFFSDHFKQCLSDFLSILHASPSFTDSRGAVRAAARAFPYFQNFLKGAETGSSNEPFPTQHDSMQTMVMAAITRAARQLPISCRSHRNCEGNPERADTLPYAGRFPSGCGK